MKDLVLLVCLFSGVIYFLLILFFLIGWKKLTTYTPIHGNLQKKVSVIIAMRNEEQTISRLLTQLKDQNFPKHLLEIIVVDDHSTDESISKVQLLNIENVQLLSLPKAHSGKKSALQMGINSANGDVIITTDADCSVSQNWILTIVNFFAEYSPVLVLSPVLPVANTFWSEMQALDFLSLQGSTAGSASMHRPIMCNGANLAFSSSIYKEIKHVYSNHAAQSGDDMFLLHELKTKYRNRIHFLKSKDAVVKSEIPVSLRQFIQQRKRWAAKAPLYRDIDTINTAIIVLSVNVMLLLSLIWGIGTLNFLPFGLLFLTKSLIDGVFLYSITKYFGELRLMKWFPLVQSFYFLYVCFTVVLALTTQKSWKGRTIKQ